MYHAELLLWCWQARAAALLRQKETELSRVRESTAQQFQADVAAAEAVTAQVQQQLEQVCHHQTFCCSSIFRAHCDTHSLLLHMRSYVCSHSMQDRTTGPTLVHTLGV